MAQAHALPPMPGGFLDTISYWPDIAQAGFLEMRAIILHAGLETGPIGESLKWGEPAWRPIKPRQGSTLRLSWSPRHQTTLGLFLNCRTTLAETMRGMYPDSFVHEGSRALHVPLSGDLPVAAIDRLARLTFTYHRPT